ncbi:MAG: hypothetical protein A2133_07165 [Actinobacteria bacterium RBG_16_64_13]|nr:MAG: hypothetical protein A2133_07165 [Actinobacteria bacterium RBG_16_64_13]
MLAGWPADAGDVEGGPPVAAGVGSAAAGPTGAAWPAGVHVAVGVQIGPDADLQSPCIVGKAPRGAVEGELPLKIGCRATVRPFTTIYAGNVIGDRLQTGQGASIREDNVLGDDVSVGTNSVLEFGNRIGNRVRIHSGCFLEMVTIEDDVFVGPNVVFTDDPHPMNCPSYKDCKGGPVVRRLARIGANTTILPGVEIGENALIGAGSVVVDDIPAGAVAVGNPARVIKHVSELTCPQGFHERPYQWPPYSEGPPV